MAPRLDLVTLLVADADAAKRFYRDVVGLRVVTDSKGYVELESGAARLALFPRAALTELLSLREDSVSAVDLSFLVEDVEREFRGLVSRGAEPIAEPRTMPWGHRVAFVLDPDGNLVEVVEKATPL